MRQNTIFVRLPALRYLLSIATVMIGLWAGVLNAAETPGLEKFSSPNSEALPESTSNSLRPLESYLTNRAAAVIAFKPQQIYSYISDSLLPLEIAELSEKYSFKFREISEVLFSFDNFDLTLPPVNSYRYSSAIIRYSEPIDWQPFVTQFIAPVSKITHGKVSLYLHPGYRFGFVQIDPQTVLIADEKTILSVVEHLNTPEKALPPQPWQAVWTEHQNQHIRIAFNFDGLQEIRLNNGRKIEAITQLMIDQVRFAVLFASVESANVKILAQAQARKPADSTRIGQVVQFGTAWLRDQYEQFKPLPELETTGASQDLQLIRTVKHDLQQANHFAIFNLLKELSRTIQASESDSLVTVQASLPRPIVEAVAVSRVRMLRHRREEVLRYHLRQLTYAFHGYEQHHGELPVSENYREPKAKYPYSWRVAILPIIDEKELYNMYRFDEPWDSEHNRKLIPHMPWFYRSPMDHPKSTSPSYFMLTGNRTLSSFATPPTETEKAKRPKLEDITDGTGTTLALVEGSKDIPWTKPEDISIDGIWDIPEYPLGMGSHSKEGFFVSRYTGFTNWIDFSKLDKSALLKMTSIQGQDKYPFEVYGEKESF